MKEELLKRLKEYKEEIYEIIDQVEYSTEGMIKYHRLKGKIDLIQELLEEITYER